MLATLIAALSPFVQLGTSYYASVASVMLVLGILLWWRPMAIGFGQTAFILIIVVFMPLSLLGAPSPDPGLDRLRLAREALMLVLLVSGLAGFPAASRSPRVPPDWVFLALVAGYLLAAWLQMRAYADGVYFGLPREWYAQEAGTLATDLSLQYMSDALRPHATFQEPSYLGFMLLSISLMLVPRIGRSRIVDGTLVLALVAGLLSRSLAFFLSVLVVILLPLALERGRHRMASIGAMVVVAVPVIALSGGAMLSRVTEATSFDTADASTADRLFGPLYALPGYLALYPAGNPLSIADRTLVPFLSNRTADPGDILNNALFNLLFAYGIVGFAMIAAVLFIARDLRVRLYLVTCAMFNGAFLAIDKVSVILLTLAVYEHSRRAVLAERGTPEAQPPVPAAS